jgi:hypothetical protein
MRKVLLALTLFVLAVLMISGGKGWAQSDFKVCESTYALCTTAPCVPVDGKDGALSCACEVKTGYSLGLEPCQSVKETSEGKQVSSRYFPVKSYAVCSNDRPWAWCLDKPCVIDPSNPTKAACACTTAKNQGPYVIVTDTLSDSTCTSGIISSATVDQIGQATDFLKSSSKLRPFPIKILNGTN